jgi:hypothetical protein
MLQTITWDLCCELGLCSFLLDLSLNTTPEPHVQKVVHVRRGPHQGVPGRIWSWDRGRTATGHRTGGPQNGAKSRVSEVVAETLLPEWVPMLHKIPIS